MLSNQQAVACIIFSHGNTVHWRHSFQRGEKCQMVTEIVSIGVKNRLLYSYLYSLKSQFSTNLKVQLAVYKLMHAQCWQQIMNSLIVSPEYTRMTSVNDLCQKFSNSIKNMILTYCIVPCHFTVLIWTAHFDVKCVFFF